MKKQKHFVNYDKETMCLIGSIAFFVCSSCIFFLIKLKQPQLPNDFYLLFELLFENYHIFCLIAIPLIIAGSTIYAIYYSEMIAFQDDCVYLYRFVFSKKPRCKIPISEITHLVISNGLWEKGGKNICGRKVFIFGKGTMLKKIDLKGETLLEIFSKFDKDKIEVIGDDFHPMSINKFFRIDFYSLTDEQKLALLKRYCHGTKSRELDGEAFLKKKKLL